MFSTKNLLLALLVSTLASHSLQRSVKENKERKEHPGCVIFWFLPDCPLSNVFGVDPFSIYPWEKFCKQYSAFDELDLCEPHIRNDEDNDDNEENNEDGSQREVPLLTDEFGVGQ